MNKESSFSILANLLKRHEDAARKYREAAALVGDEGLKEYLNSLAAYREQLQQKAREWLKDMPPSPVPLSGRVRSYLHENWGAFREALEQGQETKIAEACRKNESSISEYYKDVLGQKGIPIQIYDDLKAQHKRVLEVLRKVERMEKVPMQRNNSF